MTDLLKDLRYIVGVVPVLPAAPAPGDVTEMAYFPLAQNPTRFIGLLVWTSGDPLVLTAPARNAIRELDEDMALSSPNSVAGAFY